MPDSFIQVPVDSTGKKLATQQRVVGSDTVQVQRMIDVVDRVQSAKVWVSSFRIPARAATSQILMALHNGNASAPFIGLRRLTMEVDTVTVKVGGNAPVVRLFRTNGTAPTGGSGATKVLQDTADTANSNVSCLFDASADGTIASTAITATVAGGVAWEQTLPRWVSTATAASGTGFMAPSVLNLLPDDPMQHRDDPMYLRAGQGVVLRADYFSTPTAGDWSFYIKCVWGEFTVP